MATKGPRTSRFNLCVMRENDDDDDDGTTACFLFPWMG